MCAAWKTKYSLHEENISTRKQRLFVLRTLSWVYSSIKMKPCCGFIGNGYKKIAKLPCIQWGHSGVTRKMGNADEEWWRGRSRSKARRLQPKGKSWQVEMPSWSQNTSNSAADYLSWCCLALVVRAVWQGNMEMMQRHHTYIGKQRREFWITNAKYTV